MILTPQTVETLLVSVLERITGLAPGRVILEDAAGPRPSDGLYCALWWRRVESLPQNMGDYLDASPDDATASPPLMQRLRNESWCAVQISFFGPGAFAAATRAVGALQTDERNFDLWRVLGFGGADAVQSVSAPFGGRFQARAFFTLSFYACFGAAYPVSWFGGSRWALTDHHQGGGAHDETFACPDGRTTP